MSPSGNFYATSLGPPVLCQDLETHHFGGQTPKFPSESESLR